MSAAIEIKYRGPLTERQAKDLQQHLSRRGALLSAGWETTLFFDTSIFPQVGDFATGFSRISLKLDKKGTTLRLKEGHPASAVRQERRISLQKKEVPHLLFLLDALGLHQGFYRPAYRRQFALEGVTISLKTECAIGDHFEIELSRESDLQLPLLKDLFSRFGLWCWTAHEYQQRIDEGMQEFPAVPLKGLKLPT